jgi:2-polyprenyl-6-methoxyphenol hydroxylase-like FAD-dependent oxidoreductase
MKALIIGGGIAGAVTAMSLRRAGIDSVVYESYATGADDIGAFLTIMRNGMDALRAVAAHQPVIDASFPATDVELLNSEGVQLGKNPMSGDAHTIKRATLYRALHDETTRRGIPIEHEKRLTTAEVTASGVVAHFADGAEAEADILIGADGIHSTTRSIIDPAAPPPRFTGMTIAYGYTRATDFDPSADAYRMISGKDAFFGYTTAPDGETWWFSRAPHNPAPTRGYFIDLLSSDRTPAASIVRATEDITFQQSYDVPETPNWHNSAMVLVGDAAHAASPAAGQGASMALEDSVILAKCLRDIADIPSAFQTYTSIRKPRVEALVAASAQQATGAGRQTADQRSERNWLYDHHIDWQEPVVAGQRG